MSVDFLKTFVKILYRSLRKSFDNELLETSGHVTYTILLSLFPFLILLISVASHLGRTKDVQSVILSVTKTIPPEISADIVPIINAIIYNDPGSLIAYSIIGVIWVSSSGIESVRQALNKAYEATENRNAIFMRAQSILILIVGVILISVLSVGFYLLPTVLEMIPTEAATVLPEGVVNVLEKMMSFFHFSDVTTNIVTYGVLTLLIFILYRGLPNHKHNERKPILPGCLLAAGLCLIFSDIFSYFLRNFASYHAVYKSLGGVVIFMLFIKFSTFCILFGAQFNKEVSRNRKMNKSHKASS